MYTKQDIIEQVNLFGKDVVVLHGTSLTMRGIKATTNDIDCYPIDSLDDLELTKEVINGKTVYSYGDFDFGSLDSTEPPYDIIDGIKCQTLESIIEQKRVMNRPKDLIAIKLIEEFMAK